MSEKKKGKCYFCGKLCDEGSYCYGCKEFICNECDERGIELDFGGHNHPEDHKEKP